jgi:hypothetical protein
MNTLEKECSKYMYVYMYVCLYVCVYVHMYGGFEDG